LQGAKPNVILVVQGLIELAELTFLPKGFTLEIVNIKMR